MSEPRASPKKGEFSDDEIEEILGLHRSDDPIKAAITVASHEPILFAGIVFAFGILLGLSLYPTRRKLI